MRKDVLINYNIANAIAPIGTLSSIPLTASFQTIGIDNNYKDNVCLTIQWTGAPVGNFQILVSNDNVNFSPLDFGVPIAPVTTFALGGAAGSNKYTMRQLPYGFIAFAYTFTSGSGTLNGQLTIKQVGA